jgi:hypothetical protein
VQKGKARHAWSTCVLRTGDWSSGRRVRRSIAGVRSRGCWGVLQAKVASIKVRRGLGGAHRGSETSREAALAGRQRRLGTRVTRSSGRRLLQGLLGLWTLRFEAWGSCERYSGVRITGCTPVARNRHGGRELTSGGAEAIPAERRPEVERGVLGWLRGAEAELMRRFAGAWGRWSGECAAAQCSALAERGEAAARVFRGGAWVDGV